MTTLAATYDYATYGPDFCTRVGITAGAAAEEWLEAACTAGDQYLGNPFDGSSAISPATHPKAIFAGIVAWARCAIRLVEVNDGLTGAMTGSLQEFYAQGLDKDKALKATMKQFYWPWKVKPWL